MPITVKQLPLDKPSFKQKEVVGVRSENKCKFPYEDYYRAVIFTTFNKNNVIDEENAIQSLMRNMDYEQILEDGNPPPEVTMRKYHFKEAPKFLLENIESLDYFGESETVFITREFLISDDSDWVPVTAKNEHSDNVVHVVIAKKP